MQIEKERHVLVVFPHPDDEAFGVSGSISTYIQMGVPVTYACLTLGEMGRNLGMPPFATRETLPEIRKNELRAACEAMGIEDLRMMGLRDKTVEFEDDEKMVQLVTDLIDETNPSLIITFYPGYSVHPDHEATARAVVRAVRRVPEADRPKLYAVAFANETADELGEPDVIHDVTAMLDRKINTLNAHASQTVWMMKEMEKKLADGDSEAIERFAKEKFYSYRWHDDFEETF
ncbi:bacillithiol biosynthesis deacetylase BshB2 [Edaphobacillus lindanitolerans]|uniref:Bacillithiol biosynthesis deacetylase BshB2 n=1 Tax=Edaphobacillus lindanitolerans TaxID=550447 RepID=A0A1U7PMK7_9BACI|nr:bacillithiol biosynthesis deacetylase BshB2 [Edaphobacillus lindanitolerans]SIT70115.1 bacillithiol biosynthesis deacetylase BshB2 [Edaphobacillus lindanitolerans]